MTKMLANLGEIEEVSWLLSVTFFSIKLPPPPQTHTQAHKSPIFQKNRKKKQQQQNKTKQQQQQKTTPSHHVSSWCN